MKPDINYYINGETLTIMGLHVPARQRRRGKGTTLLKAAETEALNQRCLRAETPADGSKIALSFWLKNGYKVVHEDEETLIRAVLLSPEPDDYIHDFGGQSVITLYKNIL